MVVCCADAYLLSWPRSPHSISIVSRAYRANMKDYQRSSALLFHHIIEKRLALPEIFNFDMFAF